MAFFNPYKLPPPNFAQLVNPIALCNFSKFLSRMKLCEASATLKDQSGTCFTKLHSGQKRGNIA